MSGPWDDYQSTASTSKPWEDYAPVSVQAGQQINSIPRQLGLTARYGLEGLANTAQLATEPIRYLTDRLTGQTGNTKPLGQLATQFADYMGLPQPQGANERVIGDASRLVAGSGGMLGAVRNIPGQVAAALAANPTQQLTSAAGAGLAAGASREAGGNNWMQGGAALLGGVAGGFAPGIASSTSNAARNLFGAGMTQQQLDAKIALTLQNAGVDYSQVPERVRQSMRSQMADALQTNKEFDPAAVSRLLDFNRVGATPTRGMVSQDPIQITREMNLAKTAANTNDSALHGLPLIQNQNNTTLIRNLNEAGASNGDPFRAGQSAIDAINGRNDASGKIVSGMYDSARAMPGGETQLDRKTLMDAIYGGLTKANKLKFVPESVMGMIDDISVGQVSQGMHGPKVNVPFDANALDNLMTTIATAQRGTKDGNAKAALGIIRDAINKTAINPLKDTYGGNQLVTQATANGMQNADAQAPAFMDALNQARTAAKSRFGWQESAPPIEAALNGAQPDNFIKRFVINGSVNDAQAVAKNAGIEESKNAIVAYLKSKALSNATDEFGKFSQSGYNNALKQIGDPKLGVFFTPDEITQLKAVGRVASAMQVQPVGSAVNNSNSGAMLVGKAYDALKGGIGMVPFGGPMAAGMLDLTLGNPTRNASNWMGQRSAQNIGAGLLMPQEQLPWGQNMFIPGMAFGGGLLSGSP